MQHGKAAAEQAIALDPSLAEAYNSLAVSLLMCDWDRSTRGLEDKILVCLHSGARRSEIFRTTDCPDGGLKWSYIHFDAGRNGEIVLPRSKHGESRSIEMNSRLREMLFKLRATRTTSDYVFSGFAPEKAFRQAVRAAGVRDCGWHTLRHTFATRLHHAGEDIRTIQKLLGHKSITTTVRYSHTDRAKLSSAVEKLVDPANFSVPKTVPSDSRAQKIASAKIS